MGRTTRRAYRLIGALAITVPVAALWAAAPAYAADVPAPAATSTPAPAEAPTLPTPTFALTLDGARLEIPLPPDTHFEVREDRHGWRLALPGWRPPTDLPTTQDPVLGSLQARGEGDGTTLVLPWRYGCPSDASWLEAPSRLVFTFRETFNQVETESLAAGVRHQHIRRGDPQQGPLDLHVLRVDLKAPGVRIAPALAGGEAMFARNTVSWIASHEGALAGVNGTYFSERTGEPLGLLVIDGRQVTSPLYNRAALAIGDHGEVYIGNTALTARLQLPDGESYDFDGVNQPRGLNRMVLYTRNFGYSTHTQAGGFEYVVASDGVVTGVAASDATIPAGGWVISAHGQAAEWLKSRIAVGRHVDIATPLADYWPGVHAVVGGGPMLLRAGQVAVDPALEHFRPDVAQGSAPRTAVGRTADGQVLIVTVDGRDPWASRGLSLGDLARLLRDLGAVDAMNLDGGGSTAMAIGGRVVNHPSDGRERAVNNALLVFGGGASTGASH